MDNRPIQFIQTDFSLESSGWVTTFVHDFYCKNIANETSVFIKTLFKPLRGFI